MNMEKRVLKAIETERSYQRLASTHWLMEDAALQDAADEAEQETRPFLLQHLRDAPEKELGILGRQARKMSHADANITPDDRPGLIEALRGLQRDLVISCDEASLLKAHILESRNMAEIAKRVGLKESTVRVRFFRARAKLQAYSRRRGM